MPSKAFMSVVFPQAQVPITATLNKPSLTVLVSLSHKTCAALRPKPSMPPATPISLVPASAPMLVRLEINFWRFTLLFIILAHFSDDGNTNMPPSGMKITQESSTDSLSACQAEPCRGQRSVLRICVFGTRCQPYKPTIPERLYPTYRTNG